MMRPSNDLPAVYLCRDIVDFRKGINGLSVLVEQVLEHDPFSEHLFVFCNRSRKKIKILYWERSGFCLWQKSLEKAHFKWPRKSEPGVITLSSPPKSTVEYTFEYPFHIDISDNTFHT